ncbi:MAG: hypothetical protein LBS37_11390, partial [Treponema sp.]|nr:hypothetical protein [Treponema sp.]
SGGGQGGGAQGGIGTIRIGLGLGSAGSAAGAAGGKSVRTAVPDAAELTGITFKVHLTGPGGTIDRDFGPQGGTIDVAAGSWDIIVKAYNSEPRLRGLAEQTISVAPGGSQTISVTAVIGVKSEADLMDVLDFFASGLYNDSDTSRENLIVVEQDFDITQFIHIGNPCKYTVIAEPGATRTIRRLSSSGYPAFINVGDGVLTLGRAGETGKLLFDGQGIASPGGAGFLQAHSNGSVIIDGNTEITRMQDSNGYTAILCENRVEMRGGKITNCVSAAVFTDEKGGAVTVNGGQFTMSGGEISGNFVTATGAAGGGVLVKGTSSQFTLSGSGKISDNSASGRGGGVALIGNSQFIMSGGEISDNSSDGSGGGVALGGYGNFSMSGGKISENEASASGGGVAVTDHGGFTLNGSAEISENTVTGAVGSGGGVVLTDWGEFDMLGGEISGNTANGAGGGVYLAAITGTNTGNRTFTMTGGIISGNTASTGAGGGVFLAGLGMNSDVVTFTMTGGEISGNTATMGNGGGVYIGVSSSSNNIFAKQGGTLGPNTAASTGKEAYANVSGFPVRTTTAGPGDRLYIKGTTSSAVYVDPIYGDTSSNWI